MAQETLMTLADPQGFEPRIFCSVDRRLIQLGYGSMTKDNIEHGLDCKKLFFGVIVTLTYPVPTLVSVCFINCITLIKIKFIFIFFL